MPTETPLTNSSPAELEATIEENMFAWFRAIVEVLPGGELVESEKLSYHLTFPTSPMFKGVWRTRLQADEVEEATDQVLAWFKARNAPFIFWWIGPGTTPTDLGARLMARGWLSMEGQMQHLAAGLKQTALGAPGMVADLRHVNEAVLTQTPPGFTIEPVQDEGALLDFKGVFVETYQLPEWMGQAWVDATLQAGIGQAPWKMYLGRLNGKAVAISMLFSGAGVTSVHAVATVPSARGQGIGSAITLKPLIEARNLGYCYAVLYSTEMGIPVYERLGFRLTNVRINRYLWRKGN